LAKSTRGLGKLSVRGRRRVPKPPTRMSAFMVTDAHLSSPSPDSCRAHTGKKNQITLARTRNRSAACGGTDQFELARHGTPIGEARWIGRRIGGEMRLPRAEGRRRRDQIWSSARATWFPSLPRPPRDSADYQ
jgi:hypothetical protein